MRLATVALSTVLLSGCSWLGSGGGHGNSYSYGQGGAYGCAPAGGGAAFANSAYGFNGAQGGIQGGAAGCAPGTGYNVAYGGAGGPGGAFGAPGGLRGQHGVNAYGTGLQGAGGFGPGSGGFGAGGFGPGSGGFGPGGFGQAAGLAGVTGAGVSTLGGGGFNSFGSGVTTLGSAAPFGTAVGGVQNFGAQSFGTQGFQGGNVQTVQGAPIYVPQPYPAYYQAGSIGGFQSGGGALPFGLEFGGGTDFLIDGDIFPGELAKIDSQSNFQISELGAISYNDAFDQSYNFDGTATYDVNQNTTLLGRVGYKRADGNRLQVGSVSDGVVTEDLFAEFTDLEQFTVEGGFRKYFGYPAGLRPYVGATAGFVNTNDVDIIQSSETLIDPTLFTQPYIDGGWDPTASAVIGAEVPVGGRSAIGVETGIRWTDNLDTNFPSQDIWSIPVRLRGRVSF